MEAFLKGRISKEKPEKVKAGVKVKRELPWVEKYRPKCVAEVVYQDGVVAVLKKCIQGADFPNTLFYGPPGTGKTSAILAVCWELYGPELMKTRVLELNASDERGIQVVRDKVKMFSKQAVTTTRADGSPCPSYKMVILDEADCMTVSAQAALRRTIEKQSKNTRFCLICNYISRIIEPLTSRCSKFRFKPLNIAMMSTRLNHIIQEEGVACEEGVTAQVIEASGGDLRRAITLVQSASHIKGKESVTTQDILEIAGIVPGEVMEGLVTACHSDSYDQLEVKVQNMLLDGYSVSQMLSQLHDLLVVMDTISDKQKSIIAEQMGRVERNLMDGADEFLQAMAVFTVFMTQLCHNQP